MGDIITTFITITTTTAINIITTNLTVTVTTTTSITSINITTTAINIIITITTSTTITTTIHFTVWSLLIGGNDWILLLTPHTPSIPLCPAYTVLQEAAQYVVTLPTWLLHLLASSCGLAS